jgi:hypothetical protein
MPQGESLNAVKGKFRYQGLEILPSPKPEALGRLFYEPLPRHSIRDWMDFLRETAPFHRGSASPYPSRA